MSEKLERNGAHAVEDMILTVRDQKVILDADLAAMYGVPTKRLNEQVNRNRKRFPSDFIFQLTPQEVTDLRSQIATASKRNIRFLPYAFTEHGAIMAANVLNSPDAIRMSVFVVRVFIRMREQLLNRAELEKRLADIEKALMAHDSALRDLYQKIRPLLLPPEPPQKEITGFRVRERRTIYRISGKKVRR